MPPAPPAGQKRPWSDFAVIVSELLTVALIISLGATIGAEVDPHAIGYTIRCVQIVT